MVNMIRKFVPLKDTEIYDEFHMKRGDSFEVNVQLDGNTTEYHKEGIEIIKRVLKGGSKVRPILVWDDEGTYRLLDGFKRAKSHIELGYENVEAYVCSWDERRRGDAFNTEDGEMHCRKGGQPFEEFGLFEGGEHKDSVDYGTTKFLYKDDRRPHGLRIELSECVHVHWGEFGKYRLALSIDEFKELAKAITSWEK